MSEIIAPSSISLVKRPQETVDCGVCRWSAVRNPMIWELLVTYGGVAPNRFTDYFEVQILNAANGQQLSFFRVYPRVETTTTTRLTIDVRERLRGKINLDFLFDTGFNQPYDYSGTNLQPNQERQISYFVEYKFVQPPNAAPGTWQRLNPVGIDSRDTALNSAKQIGDKWGQNMMRYYPFALAGGTGGGGQYVADPNFNNSIGQDWDVILSSPDVDIQTGSGLVIVGNADGEPVVVGTIEEVSFPCPEATLCITIEGSEEENFLLSVIVGGVFVISNIDNNGQFCVPITSGGVIEIQVVQQSEERALNVQVTSLTVVCPETQCSHLAEFLTEFEEVVIWNGFPSTISAIHPHELGNFLQFRAQPKGLNGANIGGVKTFIGVQTNGTVGEFNLWPNATSGWTPAGYPSGTKYVDITLRNTSGFPPTATGNDMFLTKRVEIRDCTQRGVYLRWRNKLGGSGYWLFTFNQERESSTETASVFNKFVEDFKTGFNPLMRLLRRGQRTLRLVDEYVKPEHEMGLIGLTESMRVEMYLPDLGRWLEVNIQDGNFTIRPTRYAHGTFECIMLFPETFIQEQ